MDGRETRTRKRRTRAHPNKCPCCLEERGKPEKYARSTSKREDKNLPSTSEVVDNERLDEGLQSNDVAKPGETKEVKPCSETIDDENKRVLRSGRSTPVSVELEINREKMVSPLTITSKMVKKKLSSQKKPQTNEQEKKRHKLPSTEIEKLSSESSFKPLKAEKKSSTTKLNKKAKKSTVETKKSKKGEKKASKKKQSSVENHSVQSEKKNSSIEKLKIRSFDNLKEEMEKAFGKSSLTVLECTELLGKITASHFKEILGGDSRSRNDGASFMNLSETGMASRAETQSIACLAGQNIESQAAKTLVSFKVKTPSNNSRELSNSEKQSQSLATEVLNMKKNKSQSQLDREVQLSPSTVAFPPNTNNAMATSIASVSQSCAVFPGMNVTSYSNVVPLTGLAPPTNVELHQPVNTPAIMSPFNVVSPFNEAPPKAFASVLPCTTSTAQPLPTISQAFKHVEATTAASVPALPLPNTVVQSFKFVTAGSNAVQPNQVPLPHPPFPQSPPALFYQRPILSTLVPTTKQKQPSTLLPRLVYVTNMVPTDKTSPMMNPGYPVQLPAGTKTQDPIVLPNSAWTNTSTATTTLVSPFISPCPVTTSSTEFQSTNKLRPILPREPFVAPTLVFGPAGTLSKGLVPQIGEACNHAAVVKQLIGDKVTGEIPSHSDMVMSQLPDMVSALATGSTTAIYAVTKTTPSEDGNMQVKQELERSSKEQAIKALLSIGGNGSSPSSVRKMEGLGNRPYDSDVSSELKVVFEPDKGIFKVDDVTIDPQVNTIGKESYTCGKCGKIFTSLSYLARHIKRVCPDMTQRKWKCKHCDKAFRHPFGLQQHVYTHTGERPHKCPQCPKAFYSSNDLRRHSRIHSGERPYKCKHCGKSFATTISLKTHTFIHTGEKPHRCPHCIKTFATSSKLGRHIVTHSEQRPYPCQKCPKTFNRSGDLRRHSLHVHEMKLPDNIEGSSPEKIYKCTECSSSFETAKELEGHISEHTTTDDGGPRQ